MTILEKTLALYEVELFNQVPTEALSFVAALAGEETFDAGERLFQENDQADSLFLVLSGAVELQRGGEAVSALGPGDVVGAWSLLDVEARLVTATAKETVATLEIEREPFLDLIADHPVITQSILRSLTQRLRRLIRPLERELGSSGPESNS
ncbi:MAG: Crp/Fnr family transcriptional regulator [Candidatus Zixiibacteriota bacterium]